MTDNTYCIIMAGGVGSRFWPLSTRETPKQFLDILGVGKTLLQQTYDRFKTICHQDNFIIVTTIDYKNLVLDQLPFLNPDQILEEPIRRNTAPCIAFANSIIKKKVKNPTIIVTPADHLILYQKEFEQNIIACTNFVKKENSLLTLGIKPSRPETGYGYIQINNHNPKIGDFHKVKTFTEKPSKEMAEILFESGDFFWNSGIFIWKLDTIELALKKHLEPISTLFENYHLNSNIKDKKKTLADIYSKCKNISIDYGIMEKADNVYVQTVDFGWSDLGTWSSLYENSKHDDSDNAVINGKMKLYDTKNCIITLPENKKGIIQGLEDYIIAESNDALLICPKSSEQQIKNFTRDLENDFTE